MVGKSVIVTGTPGTGKTTLCKRVSSMTDFIHLDLGQLAARKKLFRGYDRERESYIVDAQGIKSELARVLKDGQKVYLIEGCFAHLVVPKKMALGVVVLRTQPLELLRRLKNKSPKKAFENAQAEALDIIVIESLSRFKRVHEINTTSRTVDETAREFLEAYRSGLPMKVGVSHWLEDLYESGDVEKVFQERS